MASRLLNRLLAGKAAPPRTRGTVMTLQRRTFSSPAPPPGPPVGGVTSAGGHPGGHPGKKEVSKHVGFYKEFGRPISKVFMMAFFTYQVFYWLWLKLEKEEIQRERGVEVTRLMAEVERLRTK